jgi:hypothetical protein
MVAGSAAPVGWHRQAVRQHWTSRPTRLGRRYDQRCSCPRWDTWSCPRGIGEGNTTSCRRSAPRSPAAGRVPSLAANANPVLQRVQRGAGLPPMYSPPGPSPRPAWSTCELAWPASRTRLKSTLLLLIPDGSQRQPGEERSFPVVPEPPRAPRIPAGGARPSCRPRTFPRRDLDAPGGGLAEASGGPMRSVVRVGEGPK